MTRAPCSPRSLIVAALGLTVLAAAPGPAVAAPRAFDVEYGGRNIVRFTSLALLETISGRTADVSGTLKVDPSNLPRGPGGQLVVDIAGLKTGIDKRDEHMRGEQYLHAEKHPKAAFTLTGISTRTRDLTTAKGPAKVKLKGTFELRGVAREIEVEGTASYVAFTKELRPMAKMGVIGDAVHFRGSFVVRLADHGIKVPQFLSVKIAEEVRVEIDVFGFAKAP
jgi:polyisoprenoid-binding protein YceI